jgi:hypothetical protein
MAYKFTDPSLVDHFNRIQAIAEKYETNLVASGRFKYLRTEENKKIYVELATGHEVPVLIPVWPKQQTVPN